MKKTNEINPLVNNHAPELAEQLQANFEAFPDLLFRMDAKGMILEYSVGNPALLHLTTEKLHGKRLQEILPANIAQKYLKGIAQVIKTKKITTFDYWRKLKWEDRCFEARLVQLPSADILAIIRDITDQKQTEERLRHQLQRFTALRLIDTAISSSYDLNLTLIVILSQITTQLKVDAADILLQNNMSHSLDYAGGRGFWTEIVQHTHLNIGQGLAGQVALERQIIQIPDLSQAKADLLYSPAIAKEKFKSYIGVPLIAKGQVRGVLEIFNRSMFTPDADWMTILETLSGQAAIAIDNATMLADLQQSNTDLAQAYDETIEGWARALDLRDHETEGHKQRLKRLPLRLERLLGMEEKLIFIISQITTQLKVDAVDILLQDNLSHSLDYAGGHGFWTENIQQTHLNIGQGLAGQVALERQIIQIPDLSQVKGDMVYSPAIADEKFKSYIGVPLIAKGQVRGVLEIFNRSMFSPDGDWMTILETLSRQAANAIDNATVLADLQQSNTDLAQANDGTIEGWARALESRDHETEGHTHRVTKLTLRLARLLGMDEKLIVHVRRGALLHDIGKMSLPDTILYKPGPLTSEELEIMQQHPIFALKMLSTISYLKPALDIPVYHHEKWNGTGYPYGLKGEQIPFAARIFAIADVYDALTNDRPYRQAWTHAEAIAYIRNQSGAHFDPRMIPYALREIKATFEHGG